MTAHMTFPLSTLHVIAVQNGMPTAICMECKFCFVHVLKHAPSGTLREFPVSGPLRRITSTYLTGRSVLTLQNETGKSKQKQHRAATVSQNYRLSAPRLMVRSLPVTMCKWSHACRQKQDILSVHRMCESENCEKN